MYIIESDEGFWSNEEGWVDLTCEATVFSDEDRKHFHLPVADNVKWVRLTPGTYYSVAHAVETIGDDEEKLTQLVAESIKMQEFGFASEIIECFRDRYR